MGRKLAGCGDSVAVCLTVGRVLYVMDRLSRTDRTPTSPRRTALLLFALSAVLLPRINNLLAQDRGNHLFIKKEEIKTETCLNCHPNKKEGKSVHSAVGMGCENCHQATSEDGKTTITLVATGGELCAMCHEAKKDPVLHGPYKDGQCLTCHEPHASDYKAHTRAPGNSLCLECHSPRRISGDTVTLFNSRTISDKDFAAIPKIELDAMLRQGHPWMGHPVAEAPDPLHQGEKMSCLSCHQPHTSTLPSLVLAAKPGTDICDTCHQAFEQQKEAVLRKKLQEQQAAPQASESQKPQGDKKP